MEKLIQSYEVTRQIGAGGMATVFMGRHPALDRPVAIKVVKGDHRDKVKRFEREAVLSASLRQENLPAIYDYFIDARNNHCLVMEYVEGIDVSEILKQQGPMPPYVAAIILREAARGLEHLHEKGILHRDIKPSNVRLSKDGQIKLMDFGIAKQEETDTSKNLTSTGIIIGTPSYMSPEQASGDRLTLQSDLFSLGIMMYELLTGRKPFVADSNLTLITLIAQCRFTPLSEVRPDVPRALVQIVHKCMSKDLGERYDQAGSLIRDLNTYLESISQAQIKRVLIDYYGSVHGKEKADLGRFFQMTGQDIERTDESFKLDITSRSTRRRRRRGILIAGSLALLVIGWLAAQTWLLPWWNGESYGSVKLDVRSSLAGLLADARVYLNEEEWPARGNLDGPVTLQSFRPGRNSVKVRFPLLYQTYEFNFNLDRADETRQFTLDLDKLMGVLDYYRPENRRIGLVADTKPPGAFVYLNNDFHNVFTKTPSPQTWPNIKPGRHRVTFQKDGFRTVELERFFAPNETVVLNVELQPVPAKPR